MKTCCWKSRSMIPSCEGCIITPDGKLVDTTYPGKLRMWDMQTGEDIKIIPGTCLLTLTAAGDLIVEKTARHISILHLATLEPRDLLHCTGGSLNALNQSLGKLMEIAPNGRWLATGYVNWASGFGICTQQPGGDYIHCRFVSQHLHLFTRQREYRDWFLIGKDLPDETGRGRMRLIRWF